MAKSYKELKPRKRHTPLRTADKKRAHTSMLVAWILGIATLVGGIAAAATFLPRISVIPSDPVDPNNPFSVSFTITNSNFVSLRDVGARIALGQIMAEPLPFNPPKTLEYGSGGITRPEWNHHKLGMDERFTITTQGIFGMLPGAKLSGADLAIVVSYKPWIIPLRREAAFRFITHRQSNGNLYWYSHPID
jgi:hypothetical protein